MKTKAKQQKNTKALNLMLQIFDGKLENFSRLNVVVYRVK